MQVPVVMPQLGLTMEEGTVSEWLKKPGDQVKKNDFIFVVSTDKADVEVESSDEGKLVKIVVEAGQTVPVGEVIAILEKEGTESATVETQDSNMEARQNSEQKQESQVPITKSDKEVSVLLNDDSSCNHQHREGPPASPRARRLAKELGIDINSVKASGPKARIVEQDIRDAAHAVPPKTSAADLNRRRLIAEKMTESVQTIPHFSVSAEMDAEPLIDLYESLNSQAKATGQLKITITDLLLKALAAALQSVPEANATWADGAVETHTDVDLGLAVATDRGVVAPILRNAGRMTLADIVLKNNDLIQRSRRNRLAVSDVEGGVGTLSNLGMYGVDEFQGIITPGQAFILTVGQIKERPWVEKALVARRTVRLNLSMDHRVVDGVTAARLLTQISNLISAPFNIIANLSELLPNKVG